MKKIAILMVLGVFIVTGAFAELAIGVNGALYMTDAELGDAGYEGVAEQFQAGDGVFYGGFVEILGNKIGLGAAFNASFYESTWGNEMMDLDLNLYLSYHLFKATSFIDPFGEIGLGSISKDSANEEEDYDPENPLAQTVYWYAGAGLGVNLGFVGVFAKVIWHFTIPGAVQGETVAWDEYTGTWYEASYDLEEYALKPLKVMIGAKLIL
jgi:hypothetical protein